MRSDLKWAVDYIKTVISQQLSELTKPNQHQLINAVLYYGDYLAVKNHHRHITWCSYFNWDGLPTNTAFMVGTDLDEPITHTRFYDDDFTACLDQAMEDMTLVLSTQGWEGLSKFVSNICNIIGQPKVSPDHMFYYGTIDLDKIGKRQAREKFDADWDDRKSTYTTTFIDPTFEEEVTEVGNKYTSI